MAKVRRKRTLADKAAIGVPKPHVSRYARKQPIETDPAAPPEAHQSARMVPPHPSRHQHWGK